MLIGEYRHSLDPKGRVNFPAKLREDLGDSFIICKGLDNCLYVYRMSEWDKLVEKTSALPSSKARTIQRFFFASAVCCEPDKQGRVLLSAGLRQYAGIDKDAVLIGMGNRIEIWSQERWLRWQEKAQDDMGTDALAYLAELGI